MEDMPIEDEWLSQILGEGTRKHYARAITYFKDFLKTSSAEDLITFRKRERNFETRIIQYYQWLQKERGITSNSARAYVIGLQSFFNYVGSPVKLKNKLPKLHMKIESWRPSVEDLQNLFRYGDVSVKAWLSLSRDVPARMSDMLRITPEQIDSGEFTLLSRKEGVVGKCYVSEDTRTLFKQLKAANITLPKSQRGIDKMIASACHVGGLQKRVNQHLLRKFWISAAINIGIPEIVYKILSFKSVPQEILTYYLDREELRNSWKKVVDAIPLESKSNGRVSSLEQDLGMVKEALTSLEKENMTLKVRVNSLQSNTMELEDRLDKYGELLANWVEIGNFTEEEKAAMRMKWNIREWTEDERENMRAFLDLANELKNEKGEVKDEEFRRRFKAFLVKKEGDRKR